MAELALLGGKKTLDAPLKAYPWPPRDEATAEKLKQLYLSGEWSFNSPAEQAFERAFADYHGAKHGVFMMNGTVTLECALTAVGVGPGDEVIVPGLTWMATALAVHYVGATPVIVDIEPTTLCLDPEKTEKAITPKTKAILPVHYAGSTADMEKILAIAEPRGIPVIEDAAQMAGGFWNGRGVGSWGAVGSFSFQQSKPIACGEGGICLTNDDEIARKLFLLKHIGYDRGARQGHGKKLEAGFICHNYRATAFQALICTEQLKGLKERVERDNESFRILEAAVADLDGVRMQAPGRLSDPQGYYTFHFIFDGARFRDIPRETLIEACAAEGASLGGGTHGPVYVHPLFNLKPDQYRFGDGGCPVCDDLVPHRVLGGSHESLYYPETARAIAAVVRKVAQNVDELRRYKKETT